MAVGMQQQNERVLWLDSSLALFFWEQHMKIMLATGNSPLTLLLNH